MFDPFTSLGYLTWLGRLHLLVFCIVLPVGAVISARQLERNPLPTRERFYVSVLIQHSVFITLSILVVIAEKIGGWHLPANPVAAIVVSILFLAVMLAIGVPQWRRSVIERERKVYLFMPSGAHEKTLWACISVAAGVGEEITYRVVLWNLLTTVIGPDPLYSAVVASISFALGHFVQGWKSILAIFVFALGFHWLVWFTGSILPAIVIHTVYDFTAGMMYRRFGDRYAGDADILSA